MDGLCSCRCYLRVFDFLLFVLLTRFFLIVMAANHTQAIKDNQNSIANTVAIAILFSRGKSRIITTERVSIPAESKTFHFFNTFSPPYFQQAGVCVLLIK